MNAEIQKIVEKLQQCDDAYFNGDVSPLSDSEYDVLKLVARDLDSNNLYFTQIGSSVRTGKIKLPYTMGSLDQIYEGEIQHWLQKYSLSNREIVITEKLDGVSVMLIYENGQLSIAYSRGDGIEGADITRHINKIPSVPKHIRDKQRLVIRAEAIMPNLVFDEKYSEEFKNPRNMVAGCMNRKQTDQNILNDIDIVAYEVVNANEYEMLLQKSKEEWLHYLIHMGFKTAAYNLLHGYDLNDNVLSDLVKYMKSISDYELDGIVLTMNALTLFESKRTSDSINPEHSIKYKILDENSIIETTVRDVLWDVSKHGYLKPRVKIVPVELFGTTVTYATGFNAKFIFENKLGPGSKIQITKAGSVIPQILKVLSSTNENYDLYFKQSIESIVGENNWAWNDTHVEVVVLNPNENPTVVFKQVLDFFETLDVELLKDATLKKIFDFYDMWNSNYDVIISTILDMLVGEWKKIIGENGVKSYNSLKRRLENLKLETILGSIRYMGVGFGVRKAKQLLSVYSTLEQLKSVTIDDISSIDGFDTKTATQVVHGLPETIKFIEMYIAPIATFSADIKTSDLVGVNVVMTGFRDSELQEKIESMGGKVSSGVSKKTTHLLTMDLNSGSSKLKKATEFGIAIMNPDTFKDTFNL